MSVASTLKLEARIGFEPVDRTCRLAPENPFPAVDDVVAVYKELLKTYKPHNIGDFWHVGWSDFGGAVEASECAVARGR